MYKLSLLLTERCNLHCTYCFCNKFSDSVMSSEVACRSINEVISTSGEEIQLLLMGGEPFWDFELLKHVVEYAQSKSQKIKIKTVSNGTLIHGKVQEWLYENREILFVSLSLDGDKDSHNRNRCGSYSQIDFPFFIQTYGKNAEASMVVTSDNLDLLCHNVQYVENLGFNVKCVLADDNNWNAERDCLRLAKQLDLLIKYYISHPERKPFTMLREPLSEVIEQIGRYQCKPFINMHCVAPDGQKYACHRCTPYYNNGVWKIQDVDKVISDGGIIEECMTCVARHICCVCPALVHSLRGNKQIAYTMCKLFKVVHRANAAFVAQLFLSYPQHPYINSFNRPALSIAGAQKILNKLL